MNGIKCDECGRFIRYSEIDTYTPFGSCEDLEPPEPVFMCGACSKKREKWYIDQGHVSSSWIPSNAELNAAKKLGMVRAGPKGAGWANFFNKGSVPDSYVIWDADKRGS